MSSPLVVNADDLGVSRGATLGIVRAHREGIVTSASLAATTPFYEHALESCVRACPALGVGLHFTLTSGKPVSPAAHVPLLVDHRGFFRWRFMSLLWNAGFRRRTALLDQIDIELESQIHRLQSDGIRPDHINGERHVQLIPGIFERIVAAAQRHGIPFVRAGREIKVTPGETGSAGRAPAPTRDVPPPGSSLPTSAAPPPGSSLPTSAVSPPGSSLIETCAGMAKSMLLGGLTRLDRGHLREGVHSAEHFASYRYTGRLDVVMRPLLRHPPESGVTEIMVHPGVPEESLGIDLGNPDVEHYLASPDRARELRACIDARQWTQPSSGWRLTTFGELGRMLVPDAGNGPSPAADSGPSSTLGSR